MATATITTDGLNLLRNIAQGLDSGLVTYVAIGSGNSTPTTSQHKLDSEVFRKAVTASANGTNAGELLINMFLAAGDANGVNIEEVGFFGGNSASSLANTGIMFARALYAHNPKANTESITFTLDWTA